MNYVIQEGDTLSALAQRYGTTVQALVDANNIADRNVIRAGRTLNIPGAPMEPTVGAAPRARPASVAAMADSAPTPNSNPARTPSSVMAEVGMEPEEPPPVSGDGMANRQYTMPTGQMPAAQPDRFDYALPIAPAQMERIAAPRPGSLTSGQMTSDAAPARTPPPVSGDGAVNRQYTQPTGRLNPQLAANAALENALAEQQANEPQRRAEQDTRMRARDAATTAEANRAGADEEAANAAYSPVAAAMMTELEEPAPMGTAYPGGGPGTAQPQRAGALEPRQGGAPRGELDPTLANRAAIRDAMRAFAGLTEDQLWQIDRSRFDDVQFDAWRRAVSAAMMDPQLRRQPGG